MTDLPDPPIPPEVNVRQFGYMPLDVERLLRSSSWRLLAKKEPELGYYMINLWCAAWHEQPAGSLEDNDENLADCAGCDEKKWRQVRDKIMRRWVLCNDGRWYHPVVVEKALKAWSSRKRMSAGGTASARAKYGAVVTPLKPRGSNGDR